MIESSESRRNKFIEPDLYKETGEFERVAKTFDLNYSDLMEKAKEGTLMLLSDDAWLQLENTDSNKVEEGGWEQVQYWAEEYGRDWEDLRSKIGNGSSIDAPIIMNLEGMHHLVSGNTRLMVSKAAGVRPMVWIFAIERNEL